jgi:hypothetical protein
MLKNFDFCNLGHKEGIGPAQQIERMKTRVNTTRGYKTKSGMLNGQLVSGASLP